MKRSRVFTIQATISEKVENIAAPRTIDVGTPMSLLNMARIPLSSRG